MKEFEMSKPIETFFRAQGYKVYCEVPFFHTCIDMVLKKDDEYCHVELKKNLNKQLLLQLRCHYAHKAIGVIASFPRKNKYFENIKKLGIWLYYFNPKTKEITLLNEGNKISPNGLEKYLEERIINRQEGGEAGHPQEKNGGPCYPLAIKILEYRKIYPKAKWNELFNNIPNQYSNYKSMRCAMSKYLNYKFQGESKS